MKQQQSKRLKTLPKTPHQAVGQCPLMGGHGFKTPEAQDRMPPCSPVLMNEATRLFKPCATSYWFFFSISYFSKSNTNAFGCNFSFFLVNYAKKSNISPTPESSHIQRAKHLYFLLKRKLIERLCKVTYGRSGLTTLINRISSLASILSLRND